MRDRINRWLDSDPLGIAAAVDGFVVLVLRLGVRPAGPRHRVLVIANQGLEDDARCVAERRRSAPHGR